MQELARNVLVFVSGGLPTASETMSMLGGIGGGVGANFVIGANGGTFAGASAALSSTGAITLSAAAFTAVGASAVAGAAVGTAIYENLPTSTQDYIGGKIVAPVVNIVVNGAYSVWSGISSMFGGSVGGGSGGKNAPKAQQ